MRFAKWVFLLAGASGVAMVLPAYFLEERFGRDFPPPVNHPELYYGFFGVTLAWQFMFLVIGSDPVRFRRAMLPSMLEKASFAVAIPLLYATERVTVTWVGFASMDATWLVLFAVAYLRTSKEGTANEGPCSPAAIANLFADIPSRIPEELAQTLLTRPGLRIERIVSRGHASPEGVWLDQDIDEWVILIQGGARLGFEDGEIVEMTAGSFLEIPARRRHRVEWTAPDQDSIWLAVHHRTSLK
jgi:cupin 2 domain-containing protein